MEPAVIAGITAAKKVNKRKKKKRERTEETCEVVTAMISGRMWAKKHSER